MDWGTPACGCPSPTPHLIFLSPCQPGVGDTNIVSIFGLIMTRCQQLSAAVSCQLLAVSCQLSAVSCQLSAVSCQRPNKPWQT